jgi:hypothetical protein
MDDLGMTSAQAVSSLAVHAVRITDRARRLARDVLHFGVHSAFAIARSHYENIDLTAMIECFAPYYTDAQLDVIEVEVAPQA